MTDPTIWNQFFIWPILNALIALYKTFEYLSFPGPLGFAIISLTIIMRFILWPVMAIQMHSAKKMQRLKPHLDELTKKHKEDKQALQKAQMELYKEHNVNPAAGCLPLLLQMPVLIALYNVFHHLFQITDVAKIISEVNGVVYLPWLRLTSFDLTFLGIDLTLKPSQWQTHGYWLFVIPVATAFLQWFQTNLMIQQSKSTPLSPPPPPPSPPPAMKSKKKNIATVGTQTLEKKDEKPVEDMTADIQKQMAIISPLMFGYFAFQFPIGLALYWNVFGIFGIIQTKLINNSYGKRT